MNFKIKVLLLSFFIVVSLSAAAQAMGERQNYATSNICDTSDRIKTFTLVSPDEKKSVKETFKVPLRYMNMIFEREGKVDTSIHIAADWNTLEPQCQKDGNLVKVDDRFTVRLSASINKNAYVVSMKKHYSKSEVYEDIHLEKYPEFTIRDFHASVRQRLTGPRYVAVYPKDTRGLPENFLLLCWRSANQLELDTCSLDFSYTDTLNVQATFSPMHLESLDQVYQNSIALIKKFKHN